MKEYMVLMVARRRRAWWRSTWSGWSWRRTNSDRAASGSIERRASSNGNLRSEASGLPGTRRSCPGDRQSPWPGVEEDKYTLVIYRIIGRQRQAHAIDASHPRETQEKYKVCLWRQEHVIDAVHIRNFQHNRSYYMADIAGATILVRWKVIQCQQLSWWSDTLARSSNELQ